jgi:hypothetical protein
MDRVQRQDDLVGAVNILRRAESARIACQVSGETPPATGTDARVAEPRWKCSARACADFSGYAIDVFIDSEFGPCVRGPFLW